MTPKYSQMDRCMLISRCSNDALEAAWRLGKLRISMLFAEFGVKIVYLSGDLRDAKLI